MSDLSPDPGQEVSRLRCYDVLRSIGAIAFANGDVRAAVDCLSDDDLTQVFVVAEMQAMAVVLAAKAGPLRSITTEG